MWVGWPVDGSSTSFSAYLFLAVAAQVTLYHWRQNFRHWSMWIAGDRNAALGRGGAAPHLGEQPRAPELAGPVVGAQRADGAVGTYYHWAGVGERVDGYTLNNFMVGPPPGAAGLITDPEPLRSPSRLECGDSGEGGLGRRGTMTDMRRDGARRRHGTRHTRAIVEQRLQAGAVPTKPAFLTPARGRRPWGLSFSAPPLRRPGRHLRLCRLRHRPAAGEPLGEAQRKEGMPPGGTGAGRDLRPGQLAVRKHGGRLPTARPGAVCRSRLAKRQASTWASRHRKGVL